MNLNSNLVGRKVNVVSVANGMETTRHAGEIVAVYLNEKNNLRFLVLEPEGNLVIRLQSEIRVLETARVFNKKSGFYENVTINTNSGLTNI